MRTHLISAIGASKFQEELNTWLKENPDATYQLHYSTTTTTLNNVLFSVLILYK